MPSSPPRSRGTSRFRTTSRYVEQECAGRETGSTVPMGDVWDVPMSGTWPGQSRPGRAAGALAAGLFVADPIQQLLTAMVTLINPGWRSGGSCSAGPHLTRKGPGSAFSMDMGKSRPRSPLPNTPACSRQVLLNPQLLVVEAASSRLKTRLCGCLLFERDPPFLILAANGGDLARDALDYGCPATRPVQAALLRGVPQRLPQRGWWCDEGENPLHLVPPRLPSLPSTLARDQP